MTDLIVLCYHALSPTWTADLSTTPERFERQIELLARRGYRGVTFSEAMHVPAGRRVVAITFDDAFRSVLELARPVLDSFRMPATVFAPTRAVDAGGPLRWPGIEQWLAGPDEHELTPMSWEELGSLAADGWEIGSHTATHPRLTQLDDEALAAELSESKAACERHLGGRCATLAYPYGDVDGRVVRAAEDAGYEAAAALPRRLDRGGALQWPRVGVYRTDGERRFRMKVSPAIRRLRRSGAWTVVGDALAMRRRNPGRARS